MKKTLLFVTLIIFASCKNDIKKENYPEELSKVFEKHGSMNVWQKMKLLSFNKGAEVHTADLHSRKTVINAPNYSLGFNGKETWLSQEDSTSFKGNKDFYYNLYFYFYAMPFVLADDGITYEKVAAITFEGVNYPGYKIAYASDKGTSPEDNYMVYYHPETYQMEWLAYTVTFGSKKANDNYHLIKYHLWETVNGVVLPKEIIWYDKDKNGMPTAPAKPATVFTLPLVSQASLGASFFEKPVK